MSRRREMILTWLRPRVGEHVSFLGRWACTKLEHPPGPVFWGCANGEEADLRCRACGETVTRKVELHYWE